MRERFGDESEGILLTLARAIPTVPLPTLLDSGLKGGDREELCACIEDEDHEELATYI